jgi:hypothetical protein
MWWNLLNNGTIANGLVSFMERRSPTHKRAAFEAKVAQDASVAVAAAQAIQPPEEGNFTPAIVAAALADAYEAGRTATLPTKAVDAPKTPEGTILMAPYPKILVRAINIAARLVRQKPPQRALEAEFATWSKLQKAKMDQEPQSLYGPSPRKDRDPPPGGHRHPAASCRCPRAKRSPGSRKRHSCPYGN